MVKEHLWCYCFVFFTTLVFLWKLFRKAEDQNFEQKLFKMVDISNLKINERANVERPNLRVATIKNEIYIKGQYDN